VDGPFVRERFDRDDLLLACSPGVGEAIESINWPNESRLDDLEALVTRVCDAADAKNDCGANTCVVARFL
jgi:hypothetical protein